MSPLALPQTLYVSAIPSGNAHKVQFLAAHLGLSLELREKDILASPPETQHPEFLTKNPNGRIPVLEFDDGRCLAESNAILCYLAEGSVYLPDDRWSRAKVMQWLFFEQYSHESNIAVLKFWTYFGGLANCDPKDIDRWKKKGHQALDVMELRLVNHAFLVDAGYSIADMALFAYTRSASDIGLDLESRPGVRKWLERVPAQAGFRSIAAH